MRRVQLESPFAGDVATNLAYAHACMADSLGRGEAPFASHVLYPLVLDDKDPVERDLGIRAGLAWGRAADLTVVYQDLGISPGMRLGIKQAELEGRPVEYRSLGNVAAIIPQALEDESAALRKRAIDAECELAGMTEELADVLRQRNELAVAMLGFLDSFASFAGPTPPMPAPLAKVRAMAERIAKPLVADAAKRCAS